MGRSVSYPSEATVVTFATMEFEVDCAECDGEGCELCDNTGSVEDDQSFQFDQLTEDFRQHLKHLFPSVEPADSWIGREDHVLAENKLARFGMSEYCGLVAYWIVPRQSDWYERNTDAMAKRWVKSIADKFVAAFGELSKVGSMSNGEGVYRRIDK